MKTLLKRSLPLLLAFLLSFVDSARAGYDPTIGRWLSRDPDNNAEFLPEGPNLYAYVGNSPTNRIDPLGLWVFGIGGSFDLGFIFGIEINLNVVIDDDFRIGITCSPGAKIGPWAGLGFSPQGFISTADTIHDYAGGPAFSGNLDIGVAGASLGGAQGANSFSWNELFGGHDYCESGSNITGFGSLTGPGLGGSVGGSIGVSQTWVWGTK
jgi:hypothetical protein